jgi:heat-inducible transcriptional repressor
VAAEPVQLSPRQAEILQAIVEDYIATAEPVGSRALTKRNRGIELSPASVRNVMADLEDLGYLMAAHASAGRVPTGHAIRVYVEQLAQRGRISARDREIITAVANTQQGNVRDVKEILRETGRVLSTLCHQATLVMLPRLDEVVFADIEFVPVRADAVLAVFVAKSGLVQHRVLSVDFPLDRDELRRMSNYLKSLLDGKPLSDVRAAIVLAMRDERAQADRIMRQALTLGEQTLNVDVAPEDAVIIDGERNFFDQPEFADVNRLRNLLRAFEEKTVLLKLLNAAVHPPVDSQLAERGDTRVVFGAEASLRETKDLAVVMASYAPGSPGHTGQVGVVGPMRMDYARVIPLVEYTAGALSESFGAGEGDPERNDRKP